MFLNDRHPRGIDVILVLLDDIVALAFDDHHDDHGHDMS